MTMFCLDTRAMSPETARSVWVEAKCDPTFLMDKGRPIQGWSVWGSVYNQATPDHVRRLGRYCNFGMGGRAGTENFYNKGAAMDMLRALWNVANSDESVRWLRGEVAHAERQRVWSAGHI